MIRIKHLGKNKYVLAAMLALVILVGLLSLSGLNVLAVGGTLTKDSAGYYLIYDKADLIAFAKKVNNKENTINAKLMADITFNENVIDSNGDLIEWQNLQQWTPMGHDINYVSTGTNRYLGIFDGNGKTIKGLFYDYIPGGGGSEPHVGLFGAIGVGGVVKNLGVVDGYIRASQRDSFAGSICAKNYGTIINCYSTTTLKTTSYTVNSRIGGICGLNSDGIIENCYNEGKVVSTLARIDDWNTGSVIGGVCGQNGAEFNKVGGQIISCFNKGVITDTGRPENIGGICGHNFRGDIKYSYNTATINSNSFAKVGGVVGYKSEGNITNCYNTGMVIGESTNLNVGGICGDANEYGAIIGVITNGFYLDTCGSKNTFGAPKTTTQMKGSTVLQFLNTGGTKPHFENDRNLINSGYPVLLFQNNITSGKGTKELPYLIRTKNDLIVFAGMVNGGNTKIHGKLMNDIALNTSLIDALGNKRSGNFDVWSPIGNLDNRYGGTFDGNKKTIKGLYIETDGDYLGLFGVIDTGGVVKNLGLTSGYIEGTGSENYVGGICGQISGTIEGCYNKNTIAGTNYKNRLGGISGNNINATIKNCYNTGKIKGTNDASFVGGVSGYIDGGNIINCYNAGVVEGESGDSVGGICGWNYRTSGTITNSYFISDYGNNTLGTSKTEGEMKTAAFVSMLNVKENPAPFGRDTDSINGGFPILEFKNITVTPPPETTTITTTTTTIKTPTETTTKTTTKTTLTTTAKVPSETTTKTTSNITAETTPVTPPETTADTPPDITTGATTGENANGSVDESSGELPDETSAVNAGGTVVENPSETTNESPGESSTESNLNPLKPKNDKIKFLWIVPLIILIIGGTVTALIIILRKKSK